ncbi:MAG: CpaD family pilus assembly lipoprotein [Acetobacterales bacterium]
MPHRRRLFAKRPRPALAAAKIALVAGSAWLQVGCALPPQEWAGASTEKEIAVRWVERRHDVAVQASGTDLSAAEARSLAAFVRAQRGSGSFRIAAPAAADADRIALVAESLRRQGVPVASVSRSDLAGARAGTVAVFAGHHIADVAGCPDWSRPPGGDPYNRPHGNFGCATKTNLARMLADPGDLTAPGDMGPARASRLNIGVQRHDRGDLPPLPSSDPQDESQ